jgi:succinyl-diaminopimelate desuccinylase
MDEKQDYGFSNSYNDYVEPLKAALANLQKQDPEETLDQTVIGKLRREMARELEQEAEAMAKEMIAASNVPDISDEEWPDAVKKAEAAFPERDKLFAYINAAGNMVVDLETELTRRPAIAPDSGGEGELDKCLFLQEWLAAKGFTQLERFDAPDPRAKGGIRPNLVATINGKSNDKRLWIVSHLDVVPPGDRSLWKSDPWTVVRKGDKLIGRGVEDNQQGLCASITAALALMNAGITPPYTVKLLFVADEEEGSAYGIQWLLKNHPKLFKPKDMVLAPDSGNPAGDAIEIAEKTLLWVRFQTTGKQTHGSRPDQGVNASLAGAELAVAQHDMLTNLFREREPIFSPPYSTFQPTKKEANVGNINTIPGEDVFYMDIRLLPRHPADKVLAEVDRICKEVEHIHHVRVHWTVQQRSESLPTSPVSDVYFRLSMAVSSVYGTRPGAIGIGGGTIAAPLRNQGISAVVWSRIHDTAHQPNEYALISNILGDAKVMALLMSSFSFF